ncbi:MAG: nucleoside deaminase [Verrucomicrobiia bacterium]
MKEQFMREAIHISDQGMCSDHGGPFGAVIVKDGKIIGRGCNQVTSTNDPTAHAEMVAIRDACKNVKDFSLDGAEIYTSCEPCPMCLAAIYWARIAKIYYANTRKDAADIGFDDDFIYREVPLPLEKRSLKIEPLLRDEAQRTFQAWLKKDDKIPY